MRDAILSYLGLHKKEFVVTMRLQVQTKKDFDPFKDQFAMFHNYLRLDHMPTTDITYWLPNPNEDDFAYKAQHVVYRLSDKEYILFNTLIWVHAQDRFEQIVTSFASHNLNGWRRVQ
jgi:hypothetical protein